MSFDFIYKVVSMVTGLGVFIGITHLVIWAIRLEPRIVHLERETVAHGILIQQFTLSMSRIEGFLEAFEPVRPPSIHSQTNLPD